MIFSFHIIVYNIQEIQTVCTFYNLLTDTKWAKAWQDFYIETRPLEKSHFKNEVKKVSNLYFLET